MTQANNVGILTPKINASGQLDVTTGLTGATPVANGGTGATTLAAATIATLGYTTTATAAGTTTLTVSSTATQFFTGSTTQTVVLPVTSTLTVGQQFIIHNNSSGSVTINSSGANLVGTATANTTAVCTCILTTGTTAASWDFDITGFTTALPTARGGTGLTTLGTANQVLAVNAGATALEYQTVSGAPTTQYAIGSYILGRPANTTSYNNATIAGSSLYATPAQTYYASGYQESPYGPYWQSSIASGFTGEQLVNTGTWRCVSIAFGGQSYSSGPNNDQRGLAGLWVRSA